jgi:PAS domain S-box-containing protein
MPKTSRKKPRPTGTAAHRTPERPREKSTAGETLRAQIKRLSHDLNLHQTLFDNTPDMIYFKDAASRFLKVNHAWAKWKGLRSPDDAIGKSDADFFRPEFAKGTLKEEQRIIRTGKPLVGKIEHLAARDSCYRWLLATKVPVINTQGKIVGTCGITRNITPLKDAEEALSKARDELELRVQERTADLKQANERLEARLSQLHFLNDVSFQLAQFISLEELCPAVIEAFVSRVRPAEASLCLRTASGFSCRCATRALDTATAHAAAEKAIAPFFSSELQRPVLLVDWRNDEYVGAAGWPSDLTGCYLAIPLLADNKAVGIMQLFAPAGFAAQYDTELPVLSTLAANAAVCLSNALHYHDLGEQARVQGELDAARSIQQRFTPRESPVIPRVQLKGIYCPAYEVGGDYLDYFKADNGNWVIVVADVCGKGIPAALFMTMLRSVFRTEGRDAVSSKKLVCAVNETMLLNLDDRSFVTALCLIIDANSRSLSYSRAGHPSLLRLRSGAHGPENVACNGLAMGLVADTNLFAAMIEEVVLPLEKGDQYLVYTDGLVEATDPGHNAYSQQRLMSLLSDRRAESADGLIQIIMDDLTDFTKESEPTDDLTVLAMQVTE